MKYLINEEIDTYIREIFAWTFDHEAISLWLIAIPISIWVIIGLFVVLAWDSRYEDNMSWKKPIIVTGSYVFIPMVYLFVVGYVGYFIFN